MNFENGFVKVGDADVRLEAVSMVRPADDGHHVIVTVNGGKEVHFPQEDAKELLGAIATRRYSDFLSKPADPKDTGTPTS